MEPSPVAAEAPAAQGPAEGQSDGPSVTFANRGRVLVVPAGRTLCEVAEANGIEITAECHSGICGSDPIRILSGGEHLSALGDGESDTLQDICELEAGACRLACMVKIVGPVEVEIIE